MTATTTSIPKAFVWRRLHSLTGLWLVLFLLEHLLTNSQAALWIGDNGKEFVNLVKVIHNLPYIQAIEIVLIGVPIVIHGWWGIKYALTGKFNSFRTDGSTPYLPLKRNRAYTWQRVTSWILLVGIILHVAKFRFLDYPIKVHMDSETVYLIEVSMDKGLYTVADRLDVKLYDAAGIDKMKEALEGEKQVQLNPMQQFNPMGPISQAYDSQKASALAGQQRMNGKFHLLHALEKQKVSDANVIAVCNEFGTASLLAVRNTFKNTVYIVLYTIFVVAACYHAGNGFWTFLITWGWVMKMAAQRAWVAVSVVLIGLLLFFGLAAIYGTYWGNLRY